MTLKNFIKFYTKISKRTERVFYIIEKKEKKVQKRNYEWNSKVQAAAFFSHNTSKILNI